MNKLLKKVSAAFFASCILASSAPFANSEEDGIVYVSSFGKINYDGKSHTAEKSLTDALAKLGASGGTVVLQGNQTLPVFSGLKLDKLTIEGLGTKASGNLLTYSENELDFHGKELHISNAVINAPADALIASNGAKLTLDNGFDSYFKETYSVNGNTVSYPSPLSVCAGSFDGISEIEITSGKYGTISAGRSTDRAKGVSFIKLSDINVGSIYATSENEGYSIDGSLVYELDNVTFDKGSFELGSGKVSGDIIVLADNITDISGIKASDSISGKTYLVSNSDIAGNSGFDVSLKVQNGKTEAVFDGASFGGFKFTDINGFDTSKISVDGIEKTSDNGVFVFDNGKHTVSVIPEIKIGFSENGASFVSGYDDGSFRPQNNMTRAEAITLLARIIADENIFKEKITADYADISECLWASPYIGLFQKLGYLSGLEDGDKICPTAKMTRGEFCELIEKIYPVVNKKLLFPIGFPDVEGSYKFRDAVGKVGFAGIVTGYEDGTFRKDNLITRAEAVTIINRLIGRIPSDSSKVLFSDTASHWAKAQINAASSASEKDGEVMWTTEKTNKFDEYMQYRGSLANTKNKILNDKKCSVAFIGGSVTAGAGASDSNKTSWRANIFRWFEQTYPECAFTQVNAAIGDSYTKYAVYRMDNDLLRYDYDIVFIEYAINDSNWYSAKYDSETIIYFETLVRRIYEHNPNADIVIVYTIDDKIDRRQKYFPTAAAQEKIAEHYDIPSVNFGRALADYIGDNEYKWNDYFSDYVHPNDTGYTYYTAVLSEYLANALTADGKPASKVLPEKNTKKELWYDLTMLEASEIDLSLSKNWALTSDGLYIHATDADNELVIKTKGSDICIASPRDDEMYYTVDGGAKQFMKMNRKPQTLAENLSDTEHTLRIYAQDISKLRIQRVMYNGK